MELFRRRAYARAGLLGNPSDGYHGKTLSVVVRDFFADAVLYEWPHIEIMWSQEDRSRFDSVHELVDDVERHGYYGGIRLVKATVKRFVEYCTSRDWQLHDRNFTIRYESNIPRQVGLAGSSAIIVATLRALMEFYGVDIPQDVQPSLVLSVETGELDITAGLQDRVIQVYEGLVYMDFDCEHMYEKLGYDCGVYESLDPSLLPPIYLAFSTDVSEPTEVFHNNLRERFDQGEERVVRAMQQCAELTVHGRQAILEGDSQRLAELIDENFDTRHSICRLPEAHVSMIQTARQVGASAKFAGSGGAIIGTYRDDSMFDKLKDALDKIGCRAFKPRIVGESAGNGAG